MRSLKDRLTHVPSQYALIISGLLTILLLVKNVILYILYSYAFYPDSNMYVLTGTNLSKNWFIPPITTLPYPLLNALANSFQNPATLIWIQMIVGAIAGGVLVFAIARQDKLMALILAAIFLFDLVWAALTRTLLTDALFASFNVISLTVIVSHYDRRSKVGGRELFLSGILYGWTLVFRPSNIFLTILLPPLYYWLTRSWKKTASVLIGVVLFFCVVGLVNCKGTGTFYLLPNGASYTDAYVANPLFVYKLYAPDNGPVSKQLDQILQSCYPGLDYSTAVDRGPGDSFDSVNNMDFVRKVIQCLNGSVNSPQLAKGMIPKAYVEAILKRPIYYLKIIYQENAVFIRYNNPYILRWELSASKNYGCDGIPWCDKIQQSRYEWDNQHWFYSLYEKVASKVLQVYLAPVGVVSYVAPEKSFLPYTVTWISLIIFLLLTTRGRIRFLVFTTFVLIQYTALVVIAGLGFTERYAAMLSPLQGILSSIFYTILIQWILQTLKKLKGKTIHYRVQ